jgi:serine/threonine protein kinase
VLDYDDSGVPFVVMELVEGPSLADLIAMSGRVDVARAAEIFTHAAEGLRAGVEFGIVHRDVKPGNILLARNGTAKVADLGLALATTDQSRRKVDTAGVVGTCAYVAPEQARAAREVDFRADIYSLGATFYHAVTGRLPFEGRSAREMLMKHATEPVTPPHLVAPGLVDEAASAVIVRMLAKDPADRYPSYDALLDDLRGLGRRTPPVPSPASQPATPTAVATAPRSGILGRIFQYRSKPDA